MFAVSRSEVERMRTLMGGVQRRRSEVRAHEDPKEELQFLGPFNELMVYAGLEAEQKRVMAIRVLIVSMLFIMLGVVSGKLYWVAILGAYLFIEDRRLHRKVYARATAFEKDYTALLLSLASAVKTGLDPLEALGKSSELFQPESQVRKELGELKVNIEHGTSEEEALRSFAKTVKHPDIRLFQTALILSRKEGSSLSECLQRLARVTRQRQSFRRKMRSAVALQKLSAIGIAGCAIVIGIIQWGSNPEGFLSTLHHPIGSKALLVGFTLIMFGLTWMLRMTCSRI